MNTFFQNNRNKLGARMDVGDLAILFSGKAPKSTADAHYSFMPNKNFFYFTGCTSEHFIWTLLKTEKGLETTLFIEKPDYDIEKWIGRKMTKEVAKEISGIEEIQYIDTFHSSLNKWIQLGRISNLNLDLERLDWDEKYSVTDEFSSDFKNRYPQIGIKTLHQIEVDLRMIKDDYEIQQIKHAVELTQVGLDAILAVLKPGMFEYQLEATFSHAIRMNGADGNSFPTIAASGKDAVILHYVENDKVLNDGDLVLLDLGAQYNEYAADITRTYPVSGKFSERQKTLYNIVLKAQEAVIEAIKPGMHFEELNTICKKTLTEELITIGLIADESELTKYYYHGVSHHLGLDVHDLGLRNTELKPGMVLTVEPGLYIEDESIGIRIEEDVLVTENGNEVLSLGIPKTVEAIETIMKRGTNA
ncbi:MAG: aminopeptidase P family protein [Clostridia bacterium]|nr:aminopeptidase P family protein [Clostridia bacterium]